MGCGMQTYKKLLEGNPSETEMHSFPVDGERVPVALRILGMFRDAAKDEVALWGMSFSAFVRTCMIEELAKRGA